MMVSGCLGVSYWFTEIGVLNYLAGHFDTIGCLDASAAVPYGGSR